MKNIKKSISRKEEFIDYPTQVIERYIDLRSDIFKSILFSVLENRKKLMNVDYNDLVEAKTLSTLYNDIIPSISNNFYNLSIKNFCIEDSKHVVSMYKNFTATFDADSSFRRENMYSISKTEKLSVKPIHGLPVFIFMHKTKTKTNYVWTAMTNQFHNKKRVYSDITGIIEVNNIVLFKTIENYLDSLLSERNIKDIMNALGVTDDNVFNLHICLLASIHTDSFPSDINESVNEVLDIIYNPSRKKKFRLDAYYLFLQYKTSKNVITTNPFLLQNSSYVKVRPYMEYKVSKYANTVSFLIKDNELKTGYYNLNICELDRRKINQDGESKLLLIGTVASGTVRTSYKTLLYNNIDDIAVVSNRYIRPCFVLHSQNIVKHNIYNSIIPTKFICSDNEIITEICNKECSNLFLLVCKINPSDIPWNLLYSFALNNKKNLSSIKEIVECIVDMKEKGADGCDVIVNKLINLPLGEIYECVMNEPYDMSGFDNMIVDDFRICNIDGSVYNINSSKIKDFYYVLQIILFLIRDF